MFERIIAFIMSIIAFISGLFGFGGSSKVESFKDLSYGTHERNVLDLYVPKENDGEIGLVLFIHGGAWIMGDKSGYESTAKNAAINYGYATASINYRYISETVSILDIIDDIDLALECIKEKGNELGVNINKVLLTGDSAGGHLSLLYAYKRGDSAPIKPAAVVSNSGPTNLTDEAFYINNSMGSEEYIASLFSYACGVNFTYAQRAEAQAALALVSPITYVSEKSVPTVINHGMKDTIVPYSNALALDKALTAAGVTHELNSYPNSNHDLGDDKANKEIASKLLIEYAETYLGK